MMGAPTTSEIRRSVSLDTDAISPDSLKASFGYAIDWLLRDADKVGAGINWNSLEFNLFHLKNDDTILSLCAEIIVGGDSE